MKVAVGLGSNLGDRRATLELALRQLDSHVGVLRASRWVRTPPMRGGTASGWFLNGVALLGVEVVQVSGVRHCEQLPNNASQT